METADFYYPPVTTRVIHRDGDSVVGVEFTFAATSADPDHPYDDAHYTDTLYELDGQAFPEDVNPDDALLVVEMRRRYDNWLTAIHPDPLTQHQEQAAIVAAQLVELAKLHIEQHDAIKAIDPDAHVPGIDADLVAQVVAADPGILDNAAG